MLDDISGLNLTSTEWLVTPVPLHTFHSRIAGELEAGFTFSYIRSESARVERLYSHL